MMDYFNRTISIKIYFLIRIKIIRIRLYCISCRWIDMR